MAVIKCMLYLAQWELRSTHTKSRNSCHLQSLFRLQYTVLLLGQQFYQLHPCLLCICCRRPVIKGGSSNVFAVPSCNSIHTLTGFIKCKYSKTFGQASKDCKKFKIQYGRNQHNVLGQLSSN